MSVYQRVKKYSFISNTSPDGNPWLRAITRVRQKLLSYANDRTQTERIAKLLSIGCSRERERERRRERARQSKRKIMIGQLNETFRPGYLQLKGGLLNSTVFHTRIQEKKVKKYITEFRNIIKEFFFTKWSPTWLSRRRFSELISLIAFSDQPFYDIFLIDFFKRFSSAIVK